MGTYKARGNTAFRDEDAKVIGRFLEKHFPGGTYTPEEIVELAKPRTSPIHKYFEWDDSRAAELYRLTQARRMIRCVVEIIGGVEAPGSVSVRVESEPNLVYMRTSKAREDPEIWDQVKRDAISGLTSWKRRYEAFTQLEKLLRPVFREIDKLAPELDDLPKRGRLKKKAKKKKKKVV